MNLNLYSPAFEDNREIPKKYTGEGENISPPLSWKGCAPEAKQLVLICDDPDAPRLDPFVHWVAYGISPEIHSLPENNSGEDAKKIVEGRNSYKERGYRGPMPPAGDDEHHYHFKLYTLKEELELEPDLSKEEVLKVIEGKILQEALLVGTYKRAGRLTG